MGELTNNNEAAGTLKDAGRKSALFAVIVLAWVGLDFATKQFFKGATVGQRFLDQPLLGLFDFRLVHNTGGAWGIFSGSTFELGIFSLVVCALIAGYFFYTRHEASWVTTIALALVVAGGIGNAIDRFAQGYVIDFIEFTFIDFPVFNVADIGVTCGFALFLLGFVIEWICDRKAES